MIKKLNLTTEQFNGEVSYILGTSWAIKTGSSKLALISMLDGSYKEVAGILSDVSYAIRPHWSDVNKLFYWIANKIYLYDVNTQKSEDYWDTGFHLLVRSVKGDRNDYEINSDGDAIMLFSAGNNTGCRVANLSKKEWLTKTAFTLPASFDTAQVAPSGDHIQVSYDGKTVAMDFEGNVLMDIMNYDSHTDTAIFTYKGQKYNGLIWRQPNLGTKKGAIMVTVYDIATKYKEDVMVWDNPNNLNPACTLGQVSASRKNKYFLTHVSNTNEYCKDDRSKKVSILSLNLDDIQYKQIWDHNNVPSAITKTQPEVFIGVVENGILPILARIHENGKNELYLIHESVDVVEIPEVVLPSEIELLKIELENQTAKNENLKIQIQALENVLLQTNLQLQEKTAKLLEILNICLKN